MRTAFHVYLIMPSRYDDEGYVISWWRGMTTPSSSLACLYGLSDHLRETNGLGPEVDLKIHAFDETVQRIPVEKICRRHRKGRERAVICFAGVQTGQFPRALDLARQFRQRGLAVMIGGFHVSGVMAMLKKPTAELSEAMTMGATLVAGEVEDHWQTLLRDAWRGELKPFYDFLQVRPVLSGKPVPRLPRSVVKRFLGAQASFDTGRGCPFHCSFCTIINVQGNTMRGRTPQDIEKILRRAHREIGPRFFIADDNFARHPEWEAIADCLIRLREKEGLKFLFFMQVDTVSHKIPRFVEKMARAGLARVFLGIESVNPENLRGASKFQNRLAEYKNMLETWRSHGVLIFAGYIIGFAHDTPESVRRDIQYLKKELPVDVVDFFALTPLPGSADHKHYWETGKWLEPDLSRYDSLHVCMEHPKMTRWEWESVLREAWDSFYSPEHLRIVLSRTRLRNLGMHLGTLFGFQITFRHDKLHPLMGGFFRLKGRKQRRPGWPVESFIPYYRNRLWETLLYFRRAGVLAGTLLMILIQIFFEKRKNLKSIPLRWIGTPSKSARLRGI